jgi:hypothetical protein
MAFDWTGRAAGTPADTQKPLIAELRAYWEALRGSEILPRRDQVDPRGIAGALEHSFLIERIAPGIARFWITGMLYNDLMGMDVRGMPMSCLFLGDSRDRLQLGLERMFRTPSILTLGLQAERALGRPQLLGKMQILPMLGRDDECTLAIGCLELSGDIGRAPRRFTIANLQNSEITAPLGHTGVVAPAPAAEIATPRPPRAQPGVPHLRLVKT